MLGPRAKTWTGAPKALSTHLLMVCWALSVINGTINHLDQVDVLKSMNPDVVVISPLSYDKDDGCGHSGRNDGDDDDNDKNNDDVTTFCSPAEPRSDCKKDLVLSGFVHSNSISIFCSTFFQIEKYN